MQWWLWQTRPRPKGGPKVVDKIELPFAYWRTHEEGKHAWQQYGEVMRQVVAKFHRYGQSEQWHPIFTGSMVNFGIDQWGRGGKHFQLTPPITMFVSLRGFYPDFDEGSPRFWIQRDVLEAYGEIFQGDYISQLHPITLRELEIFAGTHEEGGFILAALDGYLQTGQSDPRFIR